ncbi:MAG: S8 family serine peptidase, partial [Microthrixaceae bacterium]
MLGQRGRIAAVLMTLSMAFGLGTGAAAAPAEPGADQKADVIIRYKTKPGKAEQARLKQKNKANIKFTYKNVKAIAATVPRGQLKSIRGRKNVKAVEFDHRLAEFDVESDTSWGVPRTGAVRAHAQTGEVGAGIRVAVIDSGIDCGHPDLSGQCVGGLNTFNPGASWHDDRGHGTHVSGIIAANWNGSGMRGMAPGAKLYGIKVLDSTGNGDYSNLIAALDHITTLNSDGIASNDIHVVNMSLGAQTPSDTLRLAVEGAAATGAILVAASGNTVTLWEIFFGCEVAVPARYAQVIATTFTNTGDSLTGSSCTGPEVDFAAPGNQIVSTVPASGFYSSPTGFASISGTSQASPHVAGAVALLLGYGIADQGASGRLDDVRSHLCSNAADGFGVGTSQIPKSDPRYAEYFGCGIVDIGAALVDDPPGGDPPPVPNEPPVVDPLTPASGDEGSAVAISGDADDPDGPAPTLLWSSDAPPGMCTFADASVATTTVSCTDDGTWTLSLTATDSDDDTDTETTTLTIGDVAPVVEAGAGQTVLVDAVVSLDPATFTDAGTADTHTATIDWGDGTSEPGALTQGAGSGSVDGSHTYDSADTYLVTVTVTDAADPLGTHADTLLVQVDDPPPENEIVTLIATEDARVDSRQASRNYGNSNRLHVRTHSRGDRRSYVRFDDGGITGTLVSAKLRLFVKDPGGAGDVYPVSGDWAENSITWNDQPWPAGATPLQTSSSPMADETWVEYTLDVGALGGVLPSSFVIAGGSSDVVKYSSSETGSDPEIIVEYIPSIGGASLVAPPLTNQSTSDSDPAALDNPKESG